MSGCLRNKTVVVVGAGVAGLTGAVALAAKGARVTVLERAPVIREEGAGLQLSPNAIRVLDELGLGDAIRRESLRSHTVQLFNSQGNRVAGLNLLRYQQNGDFRLIHRAKLIECLRDAARSAKIEIQTGRDVMYRPEADLVVGADGLHSNFRAALNAPEKAFFTRQTAWRAVIPEPETIARPGVQVFMGAGKHVVTYPLPSGLRNLVCVKEQEEWHAEGWSHEDDPQRLRAAFAGFCRPVQNWLSSVRQTHIWGLFRHEVAKVWHNGHTVLIGDSVHPTLPFLAQGAAMAIEDAWILAACLDAEPDQAASLARYEQLRRPRVARIVTESNANARNYHLSGVKRFAAHMALQAADRFVPGYLLSRFDWLYGFDPTTPVPPPSPESILN